MTVKPIDQAVIAADTPLRRDWTRRAAGDWICEGRSGAIYATDGYGRDFYLVVPTPKAAACECGVKFTGGLHSDWCPRAGEAA